MDQTRDCQEQPISEFPGAIVKPTLIASATHLYSGSELKQAVGHRCLNQLDEFLRLLCGDKMSAVRYHDSANIRCDERNHRAHQR
jgi:hypothetical protein